MNILDRLLLLVYTISIAFISIVFMLIPFKLLPPDYYTTIITFISENTITSIIAVFAFLISIRLFISSVSFNTNNLKSVKKDTDWGILSISYNTIEQLAYTASKRVNGIKDIKINATQTNEEIIINIIANYMTDYNIPSTTQELQKNVKEYIENITGIKVREIRVSVDDINNTLKRRVD